MMGEALKHASSSDGALPQKEAGMAGAAEPPGKTYKQN